MFSFCLHGDGGGNDVVVIRLELTLWGCQHVKVQ